MTKKRLNVIILYWRISLILRLGEIWMSFTMEFQLHVNFFFNFYQYHFFLSESTSEYVSNTWQSFGVSILAELCCVAVVSQLVGQVDHLVKRMLWNQATLIIKTLQYHLIGCATLVAVSILHVGHLASRFEFLFYYPWFFITLFLYLGCCNQREFFKCSPICFLVGDYTQRPSCSLTLPPCLF